MRLTGPEDATDQIRVRCHGGGGPDVFLLHGGPGAAGSVWDLAEELGDEFRVHEPLQRRSGARRLTVARHVSDLRRLLVAPGALVGHSWGAMLGLSFAARIPRWTKALVLIGCGTYDQRSRELYRARMRRKLGREGVASVESLTEKLRKVPSNSERDRLFSSVGRIQSRAQAFDEMKPRPGYSAALENDYRGFEETWADAVRLQRTGREPAIFRAITCPVLMLHGEDDPHPGDRIALTLRRYIPQLEYRSYRFCGHVPWRERRARVAFHFDLRNWLRAHSN